MKKTAFITGISGQDGSYLAEHLLSLDYNVVGMIRRNSIAENQDRRIIHLKDKIENFYGDVLDAGILNKLLRDIQPSHIFNLAAMSHVRVSFDNPNLTLQINGIGTANMLEAYKNNCPTAKFYQASSSECFGLSVDPDKYQRETTSMNPVSPYGCSKVLGYNLTRHFRRAYNLHACNGILFNHTGLRRSSTFVEAKIVKTACAIKLGLADTLELGNIDTFRDFGAAEDYVKAMVKIINHETPDDFVVATGKTYSMRQVCETAFSLLGLNYMDYIATHVNKYLRSEELPYLRGDSTKIKNILGWQPTITFENLITDMVEYWMNYLKKENNIVI